MHRHDRTGLGGNGRFHGGQIHQKRIGIDIHKHWFRPRPHDAAGRGEKGERGCNRFGTLPNSQGHHRGQNFRPVRLTPSHRWAEQYGATFIDAGAWRRAQWFARPGEAPWLATVTREVSNVRSAVGVCDVSTLGKIDVQGPDAAEFLNRVYVNGFAKLPVGKARYGVMLNDGDGSFATARDSEVMQETPVAAAIADVNRDGHLDVVAVFDVSLGLAVLFGDGHGGLGVPAYYNTGFLMQPQWVAVADLNADNHPDIVITNTGYAITPGTNVSVFLNDGTGSFPTHLEYQTGNGPMNGAASASPGNAKVESRFKPNADRCVATLG